MAWTTPGTATAGEVLTAAFWNEQVRDNLAQLGTGYTFVQVVRFTSSGTFTKATYPWLRAMRVYVTGGGGGGGGSRATGVGQVAVGSGGGAGATAIKTITDIAGLAASVTVTIGAAGAAGVGATSTDGGAGGQSAFGTITANGGGGGITSGIGGANNGGEGATTTSGADYTYPGSDGGPNTNTAVLGGSGGASFRCGQARSTIALSGGFGAKGFGGGGGGAAAGASSAAQNGGAGGAGEVFLELFA